MENDLKALLSYVNNVIHGFELTEKIEDERDFYITAYENGLIALIFEAVDKLAVSKKLYKHLEKVFFGFIKQDLLQQSLILEIKDLFNKNKIPYIFLKGSHLKNLYPKSYMRGMGDIDILIKKEDLKRVHQVFNKQGYDLMARSISHDVFTNKAGLMVEIHPGFNVVEEKKYTKLLNKAWDYAKLEKEYQYKFNSNYELTYLVYHLAKHMYSGGIGLRSVLDVGVFINSYQDDLDEDLLGELLKDNDLEVFFNYLIYLNNYLFKYEFKFKSYNKYQFNEETVNKLIKHITTSGIHGVGSKHNQFTSRIVSSNKKQSKFKFILKRVFPSYKEMKGFYPVLNKFAFLLPVFYIVRLFKLVFRSGKTNIRKIKRISKSTKTKEMEDLFKEVGL